MYSQSLFINRLRQAFWVQLCFLSGLTSANADWHGELSFLNEYIYRGYSKSRGNPVVQGRLDYQGEAGWYAGARLSQVSFDDKVNADRAELEAIPYAGWAFPLSADWKADLSVSGYIYNGKVFSQHANYAEIYGSLNYKDFLTARVAIAPDAYQLNETVTDYELSYRYDILDNLQFSSGLGYYQAGPILEQDFFYWNLGVSWFVTTYLSLDVRYVDAQLEEYHDLSPLQDEFYPRPQENKYLVSLTLGF